MKPLTPEEKYIHELESEVARLQEWIVQRRPVLTCDRNTGNGWIGQPGVACGPYWGEPDPKDDCGECVPCKARAALKGD